MTTPSPDLSVVIPAYNAAATVDATLRSVFAPASRPTLDVVVVDDGSDDSAALREVVAAHAHVRLVAHDRNRGMCAARNTGIAASRGALVTILDADDTLVPDWPARLAQLVSDWPPESNLCFAGCRNLTGVPTMRRPGFSGPLDLAAFLSETYAGEYLPIFRGDYVRAKPYVDIGTRKSCGNISYLAWLQDAAIYISAEILRIYDDSRGGAVSRNWLRGARAGESVRCLEEELNRYGDLFARLSPCKLSERWLKLAVYRRAAGQPGAWSAWRRGALGAPLASLAAALMVALGPSATTALVAVARRAKAVKRYG